MDRLRENEFAVEQWCLKQAPLHGIASPEVVGLGDVAGTPYIVLTFVDGPPAEEGDLGAWETLGLYGRLAHDFEWTSGPEGLFTRFGRDPHAAWREHLLYNADQLSSSDPLIDLGVYSAADQPRMRGIVDTLLDHDFKHGLRHGDLAPRNLLLSAPGPPVLLDWGQASVGPIPYGDLMGAYRSHLIEGRPTVTELDVFADALGHPLGTVRSLLEDLIVLEAIDRVRWALDKRPDRVAELVNDARVTLRN